MNVVFLDLLCLPDATGFIGGASTKEGVMKMASLSLEFDEGACKKREKLESAPESAAPK